MRNKKLIINLIFILAVIPIAYGIYKGYSDYMSFATRNFNYANPLNLQIRDYIVSEDFLSFIIYNPNNFTIYLVITTIRMRNSYGSTAVITMGEDINIIKIIEPNGFVNIDVTLLESFTDPRKTIIQWKRGGGNLTIVIDYYEREKNINGMILLKI